MRFAVALTPESGPAARRARTGSCARIPGARQSMASRSTAIASPAGLSGEGGGGRGGCKEGPSQPAFVGEAAYSKSRQIPHTFNPRHAPAPTHGAGERQTCRAMPIQDARGWPGDCHAAFGGLAGMKKATRKQLQLQPDCRRPVRRRMAEMPIQRPRPVPDTGNTSRIPRHGRCVGLRHGAGGEAGEEGQRGCVQPGVRLTNVSPHSTEPPRYRRRPDRRGCPADRTASCCCPQTKRPE